MSAKALDAIWTSVVEGRAKNLRTRQNHLRALFDFYTTHGDEIIRAIQTDGEISRSEAQCVYASLLTDLRTHYDALSLKRELDREYSVHNGKSLQSRMVATPAVYILPDPFLLLYNVLITVHAAIEAGSCVVIELENTVQASRHWVIKAVKEALDNKVFTVITSRADSTFLAECTVVDQTGQSSFAAGASRLEPLSSDVAEMVVGIVDRTADVSLAAKELMSTRLFFASKSRYATDIILVNEFVLDKFIQAATETVDAVAAVVGQAAKDRLGMKQDAPSNQELEGSHVQIVLDNEIAKIALVTSRDSKLLKSKGSGRTIILHSFTSLDDVLDLLNFSNSTYSAIYLFAALSEAKYLSQYIQSRATFVNHVPAGLLAGPVAPKRYATRVDVRYAREMFEYPSPQIVGNEKSRKASSLIKLCKAGKPPRVLATSLSPLKPTGQPPAGAWDFFGVGVVVGATVYLLPIVVGSLALTITGTYYTTRWLLRA
ncbi:hypothetical protein BAUCODRAFT_154494 [Baudoinia panamericana UAMH 10762]|uniref:Aldehyde dehydrogenase domain-containing protein n=1 Tax=Baudoinia panamericana (strain UAMH 10762) TaxID=717646 RepID=M2LVR9_BAUPA|nr:uncharacterized protein BAUCODRAFT_154494 [Baudoinia panamericana UAMH 10762]EMC98757.1 hypothetical protein BAUCODRAFT_154494 [Baudoinia panamericana UAMH 10762]